MEEILTRYESLEFVTSIVGFSMLTGAYQSNVATYFVMAKEWSDRKETVEEIMAERE